MGQSASCKVAAGFVTAENAHYREIIQGKRCIWYQSQFTCTEHEQFAKFHTTTLHFQQGDCPKRSQTNQNKHPSASTLVITLPPMKKDDSNGQGNHRTTQIIHPGGVAWRWLRGKCQSQFAADKRCWTSQNECSHRVVLGNQRGTRLWRKIKFRYRLFSFSRLHFRCQMGKTPSHHLDTQ